MGLYINGSLGNPQMTLRSRKFLKLGPVLKAGRDTEATRKLTQALRGGCGISPNFHLLHTSSNFCVVAIQP